MVLRQKKRRFYGHPVHSRRSLVCLHPLVSPVQVVPVQYLLQELRRSACPFPVLRLDGTPRSHLSFAFRAISLWAAAISAVFCFRHAILLPSPTRACVGSALPESFSPPVLWLLLTSARSARLSLYGRGYLFQGVPHRPPPVRATTFIPSTCRIYIHEPGQYWISSCVADLSIHACLICGSCSSGRDFARRVYFLPPTSGSLQIPPHDGHPCLRLTLPTAKRVADFHRQVVAHAGRTAKNGAGSASRRRFQGAVSP